MARHAGALRGRAALFALLLATACAPSGGGELGGADASAVRLSFPDVGRGPSGDLTSPLADSAVAPAQIPCPPGPTLQYTPLQYTPSTVTPGACTAAAVAAFIAACVAPGYEPSACDAWLDANVAGAVDGGAGTPCGGCLFAPDNNGGVWMDWFGVWYPDFGACLQLTHPDGGLACAQAYEARLNCIDEACDYCPAEFGAAGADECVRAAETGGPCSAPAASFASACAVDLLDGGVYAACHPGPSAQSPEDYTFIAELLCGGAPADAGRD